MPDLLHVWKCTEWYVLLLSFAKHPLTFISSVECCIFNLLLSLGGVQIQSNGEDKQWRRKVEWIFMNVFIFLGMDVTIYTVDIVREKQTCWACIITLSYNDSIKSWKLFLSYSIFLASIWCSQKIIIFFCNSDFFVGPHHVTNFKLCRIKWCW